MAATPDACGHPTQMVVARPGLHQVVSDHAQHRDPHDYSNGGWSHV